MATRRVLFISAHRATAFICRAGAIEADSEFAQDADGHAAFAAYVARHDGSLFYVLAEVAEEGFQADDIPFLSGRDRKAIVSRKLGQYFHGMPFTVALAQGRRQSGRRDERVLFAALTRPQSLDPWLGKIKQAEGVLAGVFSLPQAVAILAAAPARERPHLLLITLTRGGLRQTYFEDGQLRFSRLTTTSAGAASEASAACGAEAAKLYQYLVGQRLLSRGTPLAVLVLAHPEQADLFRRQYADTEELHFEILDLVATARRHGLAATPSDSYSEALLAHLLLLRTPRVQFAPAAARRFFHLRQIRRALHGASFTALACCLLLAGKQLLDSRRLEEYTQRLRFENERDKLKYATARQTLPQLPLAAEKLRPLVARYDELLKTSPGPEPLYRRLSNAIGNFPQIEFERLNWRVVDRGDETVAGRSNTSSIQQGRTQAASPYAVVDIYATLPLSLANDPRGQLEVIDGFAARLQLDAGIQLHMLSLPFDMTSSKALRSDDGRTGAAAPKFALRVAQELRP